MAPVLFGENDNNLKVTHFALVTHFAPGDPSSKLWINSSNSISIQWKSAEKIQIGWNLAKTV